MGVESVKCKNNLREQERGKGSMCSSSNRVIQSMTNRNICRPKEPIEGEV